MRLPWRKWYAVDWLAEIAVAKCEFAGRGLWFEALNVMFATDTYQLQGTPAELSRVLRVTVDDFCSALGQLQASGLADVSIEPAVTVTPMCNASVTLLSRRLLREHKELEGSRLRMQRMRQKRARYGSVPSDLVSPSVSVPLKVGVVGGEKPSPAESPVVELPKGFPTCVEDAIDHGLVVGCPPDFVEATWNLAMGRNGYDSKGQPIIRWANHLAAQWKWEQNRRHEHAAKGVNGQSRGAFPPTLQQQLKATEALIDKHVANPRRDDRTRVPTEEEREHFRGLKRKLTELQRQIAGDV